MVTDFFGTYILSNDFVVIDMGQVPTTWGYFWVCAPNFSHVATGGKKWLKKPKSERNYIEFVPFHYWTRLDELIILVWSNVKTDKNDQVGRAANFEPISDKNCHLWPHGPHLVRTPKSIPRLSIVGTCTSADTRFARE